MKKNSRGTMDVAYDSNNKIELVRWLDNAVVTTATNIDTVKPIVNVSRWSAKEKKIVSIKQPHTINQYNYFMGGTDRMDQNINLYRVSIRSKKWWWAIFTWMVDATIQNCWVLHKEENPGVSLLEFKRLIARTYLQQSELRSTAGRPRHSSKVISDVRYDNYGHYVVPLQRQAWKCAMENCKSRPSQGCNKCNVGLCVKCFMSYHVQK